MNLRNVVIFLILAAIALAGWAAWEQRQKSALALQLDSTKQELEALRASKSNDPLLPETRESAISAATEPEPEHSVPAPVEKETGNPMAAMADMMQDPAMHDMMKTQMRTGVEMLYNDLFDLMELDDATRDVAMEILIDRTMIGMEFGLAAMAGTEIPEGESARMTAEMGDAHQASEDALKELLGTEQYEVFERYEMSQPERQLLKTLGPQLRSGGMPLSEEAEASLMDVMFEERMNFDYAVDFSDPKAAANPATMTKAHSDHYFMQQEQLHEKVLLRADSILSPEQTEVLRSSLEQQRTFEKMSMEMGLKMLGRDGD